MTALVEALLLAAAREARAGWRLNLAGLRAEEQLVAYDLWRRGDWA